jgi:hypothetical protein
MWTPDTGALAVPAAQAKDLHGSLYRGWLGLRHGSDRDTATLDGSARWRGIEGQVVHVRTRGVDTTYLFANDGRMLAQRYTSGTSGDITVVYHDFRTVEEALIPFRRDFYSNDQLFLALELQTAALNVAFDDDAFALPER